ncbi:MAG: hypothetical protein ACRCST_10785, partial [Turicibacter sp.]
MLLKKIMSFLICIILILGFGMLTTRIVMVNTMLDEIWTNRIQNQIHYFPRISYRINEDIKQVLVDNNFPESIAPSFTTKSELKTLTTAKV